LAGENRTEKATPRRQKQAREKGQVARSRDLTSSLALAGAVLCLGWSAREFPAAWRGLFERVLLESATRGLESTPLLSWSATLLFTLTAPVLAAMWMAAAAGAVSQGGIIFAPSALVPNLSRLNPASRLKQLLSLLAISRLLRSVLPVAAILYLGGTMLARDWGLLLGSSHLRAGGVSHFVLGLGFELTWKAALVLLVWSALDYMLERQHLAGDLKMSRQELRDEYKETEGNPAIKNRIRKLRRQVLRRRMLEDTKRASVVITNPTEFAIALEYRPAMSAPMVVAKGRNLLAQQIKQVARWHGIPMIENPPLAHALYRAAEVGQYIPPKLYNAVAAILAAIFRAEKRAQAARAVSHG
jgi:flagellar biosynthetic protein FlhB